MEKELLYELYPLGDSAMTIDLGNRICSKLNDKVLAMQAWILGHPFEGIRDIIIGYSSLSILYDPLQIQRKHKPKSTSFEFVKAKLADAFLNSIESISVDVEEIQVPVCYDDGFGTDLPFIAKNKKLGIDEIIDIHLSKTYRVYMMGFLPGFAYMGEVDERIQIPRKQMPETVSGGSVGIAGGQTGIYPLDSPGGWQIIGRTPVKLFDPGSTQPVKLKAGQMVRFKRINANEFEEIAAVQTQ